MARQYEFLKTAGIEEMRALRAFGAGCRVSLGEQRLAVDARNRRWCSDGFEIGCDNGERVRVAFALDCCDREAMSSSLPQVESAVRTFVI